MAHPLAEFSMLDDNPEAAACPRCGGRSLVKGRMSTDAGFAPEPRGRWFGISSYRKVKAVVCLDCGALTPFLSRADVERLRSKYRPKDRPPGQG
jgi:DNA-directed RNA polymerase subunit RPC12/RpoP